MDDETFNVRLAQWQAMPAQYKYSPDPALQAQKWAKCEVLCTLYLDANSHQRLEIIRLFRTPAPGENRPPFDRFRTLTWYISIVADRITSESDIRLLHQGLAAVAIAGDYPDFRDTLMALGKLHYAATQAGIDPTPYFEEIAASTLPDTRAFLERFLKRDDVLRKQAIRIYGTPRRKVLLDSGSPRQIAELAQQEAQRLNHHTIATGHLLLGLLHLNVVIDVFKKLGVDPNAVRTVVEVAMDTSSDLYDKTGSEFNQTPRVQDVVWLARSEGLPGDPGWACRYLLALIHEEKNTVSEVLHSFGIDYEQAKAAVLKVFEEQAVVVGDYDE